MNLRIIKICDYHVKRSLYFHIPMLWSQDPVTTYSSPKKIGLVTFYWCKTKLLYIWGLPYLLQFHNLTDPSFPEEIKYFWCGWRTTFLQPPICASNSISFINLFCFHSYHTIWPIYEAVNTLFWSVFQFTVIPNIF